MTKVKFLIEPNGTDPIMAYFPDDDSCYNHIGQHSGCSLAYANECKEAVTNDYLPLLKELVGQGYKDLVIMNSQQITAHRKPTAGEIKFGEGATHYRDFTMAEIGITKTGDIKQWFKADDGLRYYTR